MIWAFETHRIHTYQKYITEVHCNRSPFFSATHTLFFYVTPPKNTTALMNSSDSFAGALLQMIASDMPMILALIFGGCCSNVFALEILVT